MNSILRIKELAKKKGTTISGLAPGADLSVQCLHSRLKAKRLSLETLLLVADSLDCDIMELFNPPDDFAHVYDEDGLWYGVMKK